MTCSRSTPINSPRPCLPTNPETHRVKLTDERLMKLALRLARRGYGFTSPNPMVGAVLVKAGRVIGQGWHHRAGGPHGEVEALRDAARRGHSARGATLYVTLEPCSTHGRTPPCTEAILAAGIKRVVVGATDPNPQHRGKAFAILKRAGIAVTSGLLAEECFALNEVFNHWIIQHSPFVTVKAAMTVDGRVATRSGDSKWITGKSARSYGMRLRLGADAILVGINTVLADDPSLTYRGQKTEVGGQRSEVRGQKRLRRIILDARARIPLTARLLNDVHRDLTTVLVSRSAPASRVKALARRVRVCVVPAVPARSGSGKSTPALNLDLKWVRDWLGSEGVTSLLVEGGGEVNASFILQGLAQRVVFFYAPKIIGGREAPRGVAGHGVARVSDALHLKEVDWRRLGNDFLLTARVIH